MLIVIPVGPRDADNLSLLAQALHALQSRELSLLIVAVPSVIQQALEARGLITSELAGSSSMVVSTEDEFDQPWPVGADRMWLWTVRYLDSIGNTQPWLWLEPDACPVQKGWDVRLAAAYEEAGKPFFGFTRPINWRNPDGTVVKKENDPMMLGVAIYPPGLTRDQELVPLLNDLGHASAAAHPKEPFDMYLRYHMHRRGVHSTHLIYDRWRTCQYGRDDFERLECKPLEGEPTAEGGVIPSEALVVHGCKDGSLHRLVIEENIPKVEPIVEDQKLKDLFFQRSQAPVNLDEVFKPKAPETLLGFNIMTSKAVPPNVAFVGTSKESMVMVKVGSPTLSKKHQKVLEALKQYEKPRISQLVKDTRLELKTIKKLLPDLGYEMIAAGWIRKLTTP